MRLPGFVKQHPIITTIVVCLGLAGAAIVAAGALFLYGVTHVYYTHEKVGDGFTITNGQTLNPDGHPGSKLLRNGQEVWPNIYTGYYFQQTPKQFLHNGMLVFVGPLVKGNDYSPYSQLYVVGQTGTPVMVTERILGKPLVVPGGSGLEVQDVEQVSASANGVTVTFEPTSNPPAPAGMIALTWVELATYLKEADSAAIDVPAPLVHYRRLGPKVTLAP